MTTLLNAIVNDGEILLLVTSFQWVPEQGQAEDLYLVTDDSFQWVPEQGQAEDLYLVTNDSRSRFKEAIVVPE